VIQLRDTHGIPLKHYSLENARRFPGCVCVIVHRCEVLYVGRDSRLPGPDLIAHFRHRGLAAKGHPYVWFVQLHPSRVDEEISALARATNLEPTT
jgi:hypothetical protein